MYRIRRILLAALMLCGLSGIFVTTFVTVGTALADNGPGCSGEFCCGPNGPPANCPTPATQPTPAQAAPEPTSAPEQAAPVTQPDQGFVRNEGLKAGKKAGENDPVGANRKCPKDDPVYCAAWEEAYKAAQATKAKEQESGQAQGGPSLNDIPPLLKVLGIAAGLIAIIWIGSALAGLSLAEAAATGIRAGMVLARAAARFINKS